MPVSLAAPYTRVTKDNTEKHSDVFFKAVERYSGSIQAATNFMQELQQSKIDLCSCSL